MNKDTIDPRIRSLYTQYRHNRLERREFLNRAASITVTGGLSGLGMAQAMLIGRAEAQPISPAGKLPPIPFDNVVRALFSIAEMTAIDVGVVKPGDVALVTDQQGAGMAFIYDAASTAIVDGGTIFAPDVGPGRWLRQYSLPFVDAAWWGVKGDRDPIGKTGTDDTAAIQRAIDAAARMGQSTETRGQGAVLCFAPGYFLISDLITFYGGEAGKGRTHIQGAGSSSTTFFLADGSETDIFKLGPTSPTPVPTHHHSTLRDFRVFGNRNNQKGKDFIGLNLYGGGSGLVVENVKLDDIAGTAFHIEYVSYVTLRNIHAARCERYGLYIDGSESASTQNICIDGLEVGSAGIAQIYIKNMPGQAQLNLRNFRIDSGGGTTVGELPPSEGFVVLDTMNNLPLFLDGFCMQISGDVGIQPEINVFTLKSNNGTLPQLSIRNSRIVVANRPPGAVLNMIKDDVNSISIPYNSTFPLWNYNVPQMGYSLSTPSDPVYASRYKDEAQNGVEIAGRRINFGSGSKATDISLNRNSSSQLSVIDKISGTTRGLKASRFTVDTDIRFSNGGVLELAGEGSPEGVRTAPAGSTFRRSDGGPGARFYVKETGAGNIGWVAK